MGARESAEILVELTDAAGSCMKVRDVILAARFLKDYTEAIGRPQVATSALPSVPNIGQTWPGQGGINAGLRRGLDGGPDYFLIVHPDSRAAGKWDDAVAWAKGLDTDGHTDFMLPLRADQSLMFSNVPELFDKEWYWSGEQVASDPAYAWSQSVGYGGQYGGWKDGSYRARAVRRLVI